MEEGYELDLTYVTERVIAVSFPRGCSEGTYLHNLQDVTRMLRSKHADNYLVINLSERRYDLTKMNPKTLDMGWPDLHAPPLDKICTICKAMENWLNANAQHVVVIHCRGGKGRIGVIISSYVHFTNISASADQALDRFAMRKFYDDKVSGIMTPSQKRYVWILHSLLTGAMKMNPSPLFLHYVVLHAVPNFDSNGVCQLYLKVYQAMQAVYTSGIYHVGPGHKSRVCMALEPAQMLKGDIMIKCYHRDVRAPSREAVFRLQFHTGAVQGRSLVFQKSDLEHANSDPRFLDYGKVELVFSESPEKIQGCDRWQNGPDVTVDYNTADPLIRWDSYETVPSEAEVPHAQGPVDGSLYAKVRKKSVDGAPPVTSSPDHSEHALSTGSDSGHSSASLWTKRGPSRQERAQLKRLLSGIGLDADPEPPGGMTERQAPAAAAAAEGGGVLHVVPAQVHVNGGAPGARERETDILDDEVASHDLRSADSIGTLSSSDGPGSHRFGYHKSSQNSLLSDGFGCPPGEDPHAPLGAGDHGLLGATEDYDRVFAEPKPRGPAPGPQTASPKPQDFGQGSYSTHTWVRQQQMVAAQQYPYLPAESEAGSPRAAAAVQAPTRGRSSAEAVQRARSVEPPPPPASPGREDELTALAVDIDESIDQLNQLIMDLDPTFVPIPTRSNSVKKDGRGHANGPASVCTNGVSRMHSTEDMHPSMHQSVGVTGDVIVGGDRTRSLSRQGSDVTDHLGFRTPGWSTPEKFQNSPLYTPGLTPSERGILYRSDSVGYRGHSEDLDCRVEAGSDAVPPTPAFPVSPPTPYVQNMAEFCMAKASAQPGGRYEAYRTAHGEHPSSPFNPSRCDIPNV
ncbi:tensin-3-like [Anguilla anguilla]|uniref:tensin-3-like n=1 Tax=Anguilla anguilla TaxID=7936 RepID=UPI0015AA4412|nr:tensin-3-like [Anguilla anguilla]XP_035268166.1 tensin-3-like [Anguilla anguilla]XP_035268167.1 tensin-3-like [Anguilla anguilla]